MRVRVSTNLFLYGNGSIVGESNRTSRIILGSTSGFTVPDQPGRPWILLGRGAADPTPRTWTGRVDDVQFLTEVPLRNVPENEDQGELITFLKAQNFAFENSNTRRTPGQQLPEEWVHCSHDMHSRL